MMTTILWFLAAYILFAVCHVIFKIVYASVYHLWIIAPLKSAHTAPTANLILGAAPFMQKNIHQLHEWKFSFLKDHPTVHFPLPIFAPATLVFTSDPAVVKYILKDNFDNWSKPRVDRDVFWHTFQKWIGDGIFLVQHGTGAVDGGAKWYKTRKIAARIFTKQNFQDLIGNTFSNKAHTLIDVLQEYEHGQEVDMQQKFFAFTMDSTMAIFFGRNTELIGGTYDEYSASYDTAHRSFLRYFFTNMALISALNMAPFPFGPLHPLQCGSIAGDIHRATNPVGRQFNESVATLKRISAHILDQKLADPDLEHQSDLLSLFIKAAIEEGEDLDSPSVKTFLCDTVLNFIIAGRDTTACTLTWTFYILATNNEIQKRLVEEIDATLHGAEPSYEQLMSSTAMPYLNGVIYECLRLFPSVPEDVKTPYREDTLPNGLTVRPGTQLSYVPYSMGRDGGRYPDPETVRPERWIPFKEPDPFEFPVFQAGPRICLGQRMALFEAKLLTCMLLQRFTFTLKPGEEDKITYAHMLTMSLCNSKQQDSHNLWLIPHRRE